MTKVRFEHSISVIETLVSIEISKKQKMADLDIAFCSLLESSGELSFDSFGLLLGMGTIEYELPDLGGKIFKDATEIELLKSLLKQVESFHLIDTKKDTGKVLLTESGLKGLRSKDKYQYFTADYSYYRLIGFYSTDLIGNFPYHKMGLRPHLKVGKRIEDLPYYEDQNLLITYLSQIQSTLEENPEYSSVFVNQIVNQNRGKRENTIELEVEVDLVSHSIKFEYENQGLDELGDLILLEENSELKKYLLSKAKYIEHKGSNSQFDLTLLNTFSKYDFLSIDDLITNESLIWESELFAFIQNWNGTDVTTWTLVTENCPLDLIFANLIVLSDYINWQLLTSRCIGSPRMIIENPHLSWDTEIIIGEFISNNLLEYISALAENDKIDFSNHLTSDQWSSVSSLLPEKFIAENIFKYPFDFRYISRNRIELTQELIKGKAEWQNDPWGRELDWSYISENYDLDFLAGSYELLKIYIDPETLFFKLGKHPKRLSRFLKSEKTELLKQQLKAKEFKVGKDTNIVFDDELLRTLEEFNFLQWGSKLFQGVEYNTRLIWNNDLISEHKQRLLSLGDQLVSIKVDSIRTVIQHDDIKWDELKAIAECRLEEFEEFFIIWANDESPEKWGSVLLHRQDIDLSAYIRILKTKKWLIDKWDWITLFKRFETISIDDVRLIFELLQEDDNDTTSYLSDIVLIQDILNNKDLSWDWSIITKRLIEEGNIDQSIDLLSEYVDWLQILRNRYSQEDITNAHELGNIIEKISKSSVEMQDKSWEYITLVHLESTEFEDHLSNFNKWSWPKISEHYSFIMRQMRKAVRGDFTFFNKYADKIDKTFFTKNKAFIGWIKKLEIETVTEWKKRVLELMQNLADFIDWNCISQLTEFNENEFLLHSFNENLDWNGISQTSHLFISEDQKVSWKFINKYREKVDFHSLSSRSDILFNDEFIFNYADENLNYDFLSKAENSKLTENLFYRKRNKGFGKVVSQVLKKNILDFPWNFEMLSIKKSFFDRGEILLISKEKSWDWKKVVLNPRIKLFSEILKHLLDRNLQDQVNWFELTSGKNFKCTYKTLRLFNDNQLKNFNWKVLSSETEGWKYNEIIEYKKYWEWSSLSWLRSSKKKITELETIIDLIDAKTISEVIIANDLFEEAEDDLKNLLDWSIICLRKDCQKYLFEVDYLKGNRAYVDWRVLSSLTTFPFNEYALELFNNEWNWSVLRKNPIIKESFQSLVDEKFGSSSRVIFVDKLLENSSTWKGSIYHFSHVENALKILNKECIFSRNDVEDFNDSAGSVVGRRGTAHDYARFYFRPLTLTQFYNEQLGHDQSMDKYYSRAFNLGLPKCPIPVFFQFDLFEVFQQKELECKVSNGNMQTNNAKVLNIDDALQLFNFENVYSTQAWKYRSATQQEFLIKNKFSFQNLNNYKIVVPDMFTKQYIESFISSEKIRKRIYVARAHEHFFHLSNRSINIDYFDNLNLKIDTDYCNKHHFEIVFESEPIFKVLDGQGLSIGTNKVRFSKWIKMELIEPCRYKLEFYNELKKTPWTILKTVK
jgi:hypothetical protein